MKQPWGTSDGTHRVSTTTIVLLSIGVVVLGLVLRFYEPQIQHWLTSIGS